MARLIDESFEGVGYEDSWSETIGAGTTLDKDCPLEEASDGKLPPGSGSECLRITFSNSSNNCSIIHNGTDANLKTIRLYVKVNNCSWGTPAASDYIQLGRIRTSGSTFTAAIIIYYNGSNYQFRIRYYDGAVVSDSQGYTYTTNKWYRLEAKYDAANKRVQFDVYDVGGTNLFTRTIDFSGTSRQCCDLSIGVIHNLSKGITAEILYDLVVFDDATYPIGAESDHTFTVTELLPNSLSSPSDWSYVGTSKLAAVTSDDGDTGYIYMNDPSALREDLFLFSATPTASYGKILAIRLRAKVKAIPGGGAVRLICKVGSTKYPSPQTVTPSYNNYRWFCWDWETNPDTGKPWTWADVNSVSFGVRAIADADMGGRITLIKLQVVHGSYSHRYSNASPVCGGMETTKMRIFARCARPPLIADSSAAYIRLRYSPNSDMSGSEYTSSAQVTLNSDWTHIFPVTTYNSNPLSADTTYYFDVLVSSDGSAWRSLHDDFSMSYYPRYKTHPTSGNITFAINSDQHGQADCEVMESLVADSPRFVLSLGDMITGSFGVLADLRAKSRAVYMACEYYQENVLHKLPFETIWDDHDYYGNNATKFTYYESGMGYISAVGKANTFRACLEYRPCHDFPNAIRLTGTATGTAVSKLIDSGATFNKDTVHALVTYGGAYLHNIIDDTYAMVTGIDSTTQLSLSADIMASGESYEVLNCLSRKFTAGCAEFFLLDLRSQRDDGVDPHGPGADMMDGVLTATTSTLNPAKDVGSVDTVNGNTITTAGKSFLSTVSAGDVIHNDYADTWAQVVSVDSNEQLTLNVQIFSAGHGYHIYESGASHGANAYGHINRDWFVDAIGASTADWRIIGSSVNFNANTPQANDQWADYDDYSPNAKDLQRTYLNTVIEDSNDIVYLSSNRHYAAFDAGAGSDPTGNMWPEFCCAQPGSADLGDDAWDSGAQAMEIGTATGGSSNTLSDTTKNWTPDELIGYVLRVTSGTGAYQSRVITGNTATQITISPNWTTPPSTDSAYEIKVPNYGLVELTAAAATLHAYRFDGTEFSFSPLEVMATAMTVSLPAYLCGAVESQVVQMLAFMAGYGTLTGAQPAYVAGYSTLTGAQPAHLGGFEALNGSASAFMPASDKLLVSQPAYVNGQASSVLASKLAYMQGYAQATASRAAYAAGYGTILVSKAAFVQGALAAQAAQPAYLNGGAGLNLTDSQPAFMRGLAHLVVAQPAFLVAGFLPGTLAFQLGFAQIVFPCGRLYPVREPRERLQVVSRTAGGTLRVQDKGLSTRTIYITVNKLPLTTFEALRDWYDEVSVGALSTFTFYDESGAPRQVKWIGPFGLEQEGFNRYGGEIQLEEIVS